MQRRIKGYKIILIVGSLLIIAYLIMRKMTRGMRNNNPFNLKNSKSNWQGRVGVDDKGFVVFDTLDNGVRAGIKNLKNGYFSLGLSVSQIVSKYAPGSDDNDEGAYVRNILRYFDGKDSAYVPEGSEDYYKLCKAIVRVEQGFDAVSDDLIKKYV